MSSIIISGLSFRYENQTPLFECINLSVEAGRKISIIGDNGTGKSTLLKLIAGELEHDRGNIYCPSHPYYIAQQTGISGISVSQALGVYDQLESLFAIYNGSCEQNHYETLSNGWDIESRCMAALDYWGLSNIELTAKIDSLSGGEKTKLLLAALIIHRPNIILLDEPTNHLDQSSRQKLYDFIQNSKATIVVVSHDVTLLNLLETTYELSSKGLQCYGGNYDFYRESKDIEDCALQQHLHTERVALRLAKQKAQQVRERQEKRLIQGVKNSDQVPRIMRKGFKDKGEKTVRSLAEKHTEIIKKNIETINQLKERQQVHCELKIDFDNTRLHTGKLLVATKNMNFEYRDGHPLWPSPIDIEIRSNERIQLSGDNGTGKTTLVKLLLSELQPTVGEVVRRDFLHIYLDQEYSQINTPLTVLELAQSYNSNNLKEHELKLRLHRALFSIEMWDEKCCTLSGGEKMRLYLCCLMIANHVPDLIILDEPTNNLDLSSLAVLTSTIKNYKGTLIVISHDQNFIREIKTTRHIELSTTHI